MAISRSTYNDLPNLEGQSELDTKHKKDIKALLKIISRHSMGEYVRVYSAHSHGVIPAGTIRLEADMGVQGFTWTRATPLEKVDMNNVHATLFKINKDGLVPFEFGDGPSPVAGFNIPAQFVVDYATYVANKRLTNLVALEVGDFANGRVAERTAELEIHWGNLEPFTVVVPASSLVESATSLIPTGWNLNIDDPDPEPEPEPSTHYVEVVTPTKKTHRVYVDSAEPATPQMVSEKLVELGFVKA